MISRRGGIIGALALVAIFAIALNTNLISATFQRTILSIPIGHQKDASSPVQKVLEDSPPSPHVLNYFDQAFSLDAPHEYDFPHLAQQCSHVEWADNAPYLQCEGIFAGLTSIISEVKTCLKMAVDTGSNLVLPMMPLRDSTNIKELNNENPDAFLPYDQLFDADHLRSSLGRACPKMKIVHPAELNTTVPVTHQWHVDLAESPGYHGFDSHFWVGLTFKAFFDKQYAKLRKAAALEPPSSLGKGIAVIEIASRFLLFRITDDPTGRERRLWSDLSHLIRFREEPRRVVHALLARLERPFYGVHFRVENDTLWSSLDNQLSVDLDALDRAWAMSGADPDAEKPLVYLACGDEHQVKKFVAAGKERGWEVTHKWDLADDEIKNMINALAFDFKGAVDMGIMLLSHFFFGITGSAFSNTVAHARDVTGRYRGSSFEFWDDENARSHLFNDGDADGYPCCL